MIGLPVSENTFGIARNDGRSIHHRNEVEKAVAAIAEKIEELKADAGMNMIGGA